MSSDPRPPWYVTYPDGGLNPGAVPERLLRHPELRERGIVPFLSLKPGVVFSTSPVIKPVFIVKILDPEREEAAIYKRLLGETQRSRRHIIPFELTRTGYPLLITPQVHEVAWIHGKNWSPRDAMNVILQLVEGIEYLHSLHIIHMDMCPMNVLAGLQQDAAVHKDVVAKTLYIIDFDWSRQFALGPGVQPAVILPETQMEKPNGLQLFDPYSWDVYCVGHTLEFFMKFEYQDKEEELYWIAERYIKWLIGNERGCPGVCRCRPTARTTLRVIKLLVYVVDVMECCRWVARIVLRLRPNWTWFGLKSTGRKTS